jgi:hypothetical protein
VSLGAWTTALRSGNWLQNLKGLAKRKGGNWCMVGVDGYQSPVTQLMLVTTEEEVGLVVCYDDMIGGYKDGQD